MAPDEIGNLVCDSFKVKDGVVGSKGVLAVYDLCKNKISPLNLKLYLKISDYNQSGKL